MHVLVVPVNINLHTKFEMISFSRSTDTMEPQNLTRAQQLLRWATIWPQQTWAQKCRAAVPLSVGELGPYLTQCGLRTKSHVDPSSRLATTDMGRKLDGEGKAVTLLGGGGAGSP